ncbi:hypothetical protein [Actinomadura monticuli]|uniref:hypothetical protein n=1 Tax=Actinomadura monticuli TaxID=3097367 RepID=UPI0035639728
MVLPAVWMSVSDAEQERRFRSRLDDPMRRWMPASTCSPTSCRPFPTGCGAPAAPVAGPSSSQGVRAPKEYGRRPPARLRRGLGTNAPPNSALSLSIIKLRTRQAGRQR